MKKTLNKAFYILSSVTAAITFVLFGTGTFADELDNKNLFTAKLIKLANADTTSCDSGSSCGSGCSSPGTKCGCPTDDCLSASSADAPACNSDCSFGGGGDAGGSGGGGNADCGEAGGGGNR